jgi:hypothetical protein
MDVTNQHIGDNRNIHHLADTIGNVLALVISAFLLFFRMQRNRNNRIQCFEHRTGEQLDSQFSSQNLPDSWFTPILHPVKHLLQPASFLEITKRNSMLQWNASPENLGHFIISEPGKSRPGQIGETADTNFLFAMDQRFATAGT